MIGASGSGVTIIGEPMLPPLRLCETHRYRMSCMIMLHCITAL
ncbi:hypothetical protein [Azospirillum palustre]